MMGSCVIVGTDTNVGKTVFAAALADAFERMHDLGRALASRLW